ncbi:MAG TPA: hypothetical protein VLT33_35575 [Labilithrix sp.]|nr:hypothetical protein [Labilithrix sp.]
MKSPTKDATARRGLERLRQVRGAAMTEYTILIGVVGIVTIGAFISLGVALVVSFEARRDLILYPFP